MAAPRSRSAARPCCRPSTAAKSPRRRSASRASARSRAEVIRGRTPAVAALLLAALAIAGCGLGPGEDVGSVGLTVTREFGAESMLDDSLEANESDTVMR